MKDETNESATTYFILTTFVDFRHELPNAKELCSLLTSLHRSGSPDGKFGFLSPNSYDLLPLDSDFSWTAFFKRLLTAVFNHESQTNGQWQPDQQEAFETLVKHTLPKLLDSMESFTPSLCHGNLSKENIGTLLFTGAPVLFSPACIYAHNEYELGAWHRKMGKLDRSFFREYCRQFPPNEPAEQWEDRVRLYSIKFNLEYAINYPGASIRNM
ncbi:hypothetical protein BP5796_11984 [Coleophoma crateriformis]|uniref:protein-ribulosamine 3-kinase n=1 Tax=Coleophoma crateriformis TaxID=565419 RepID=A0A3D8QBN5_9HELO|nr:hypothetical protein BP5796_11984 [Coleophoma crateriformis]